MKRDFSIDVLRSIGVFAIILAHVYPFSDTLIYNFRTFDVPLMVIISGFLFNAKSNDNPLFSFDYIKKRFIRLVIPTWIFLTIFYAIRFGIHFIRPEFPTLSETIISAFTLYFGFGYVWIVRIFFVVAIFGTPFIKLLSKYKYPQILLLLIYICYEIITYFTLSIEYVGKEYVERLIFDSIGFILLFSFGVYYNNFSMKTRRIIIIISLLSIVAVELFCYIQNNTILLINDYKHPPQFIYVWYALFICTLLLYFAPRLKDKKNRFITFIGSSSMWIYLWHILYVSFLPMQNYLLKYIIVIVLSALTTLIQQKIILYIINKRNISNDNKKLLNTIFMG